MKHDQFLLTFACLIIAGTLSSCSSTDSEPDVDVNGGSSWAGSAYGTAVGGFTGYRYGNMNSLYYGNRVGYYGYTSPYRYGSGSAYRARAYGRAAARARIR